MPGLAELDANTMCYTLGRIEAESFVYNTDQASLTINWPEGQKVTTFDSVSDFLAASGKANGADIVANAYALESGGGSCHNAILQHPDFSICVIEGGMGDRQGASCLRIYDGRESSVNVRGGYPWDTEGEGRVWVVGSQCLFPSTPYVPVTFT
jgi:hypothetical protein